MITMSAGDAKRVNNPKASNTPPRHSVDPAAIALSFGAGKWFFYADFMLGKHHPYMTPDFGGLASTSGQHDGFTRRINLQAGYYF